MLWSVQVIFCISRGKKTKEMLLVTGKFSFLYVDIWFDMTKCKFIMKNSSFKMLVVFSPSFVTDTKITFVYNFVAPLNADKTNYSLFHKPSKTDDLPLLLPKLLINDKKVERVGLIKFLGVLLDEHLSWKEHIRYTENKVAKSIGLLYRVNHF